MSHPALETGKHKNPLQQPVYLDHNASTPVLPEVFDAMLPWLRDRYGNPSSNHAYGHIQREAIETARSQVAALLDCAPGDVIFTSGGTEANNLAIRGLAEALPGQRQVITSVIEHPATLAPCDWLARQGYSIHRVGVDGAGRVLQQAIRACLSDETLLLTVAHANSETGSLQPIRELVELAHEQGIRVHTDAAQSLGKVPVSVRELGVDLLSVAGHKLYAPKGVGALYIRPGTPIEPLLRGAGHERGLRPGTENVAFIVGLGAACAASERDLQQESDRVRGLRERLWKLLGDSVPGIEINGHPLERLPNTLNVRLPGVSGHALLSACPGIAASTGSACHANGETASDAILAMGVEKREALGSVRLSLGRLNSAEDIDRAAVELSRAWRQVRGLDR